MFTYSGKETLLMIERGYEMTDKKKHDRGDAMKVMLDENPAITLIAKPTPKWVQLLEIELPFNPRIIERMIALGLNGDQIRQAAQQGILPDNPYHWKALVFSAALGEIDAMIEDPTSYIKPLMPAIHDK